MNRVDREEQFEKIALYALGVLAKPEANEMAALIASDPEARAEYEELRETVDAVGLIAEEPVDSLRSARMRERLLAQVRADVAPPALRTRPVSLAAAMWGVGLAAVASLAFAIVSVVQDVGLRSDLAGAQRRIGALQTQLTQTERVGARDRQTLTDLLSPDAKRYEVPQGTVVVRGRRVYFALSRLPAPPRGHVYQAWTAAKGGRGMTPSVTFVPNAEGVAIVALPGDANRIAAVAISIEPDGGSKAPTTAPAFVRTLS